MTQKRVGIDLGTTYSATAATIGDGVEVIPNSNNGNETTPSIVGLENDSDSVIIGESARDMGSMDSHDNVQGIKRKMGDREYSVKMGDEEYTPEQVSALILQQLVEDAETHLGQDVTNAVITVPAYFGETQREATKTAGEMAGLEVDRIINEPTAACLAYGLHDTEQESKKALVYDLGGGTFDVTLVDLAYDVDTIEVIASDGDHHLGGRDWDEQVAEWIFSTFEEEEGVDIRDNPEQSHRVYEEARIAKEKLSNKESVRITIPFLDPETGADFEAKLTREKFEELTKELLDKTFEVCDSLFDSVNEDVTGIDTVLLVGGSTRMPAVQERVTEYFDQEPEQTVHPDKAVAKGAAIQASIIDRSDEDIDDSKVAQEVLPGVSDELILVDVTPKSLGVELADGSFDPVIDKNQSIPTTGRKENYSTVKPNQTEVVTKVYQGESEIAEENELLDEFTLSGIEPAPAGEPNLGVEFELDQDGILNVEAIDFDRGETEDLQIEGVFGYDEGEIQDMKEELPQIQ